jgi:hypothetical protein
MRGISIPCVVDDTSRIAEVLATVPVVFTDMPCPFAIAHPASMAAAKNNFGKCFIFIF